MSWRFVRVHAPGFSLVEIMVVIVIIGLLAGMVTVSVRGRMQLARQNTIKTELARVRDALETYYSLQGRYPTSEEGLAALTLTIPKLQDKLLDRLPLDPWGKPYQYNIPGGSGGRQPYDVICYGADGREGGEGENADISCWPPETGGGRNGP